MNSKLPPKGYSGARGKLIREKISCQTPFNTWAEIFTPLSLFFLPPLISLVLIRLLLIHSQIRIRIMYVMLYFATFVKDIGVGR
jgi:hypothetical protein